MIKYLPSHEYARIEGNEAYIGISPYAAKQLGNVVYVDMPEVDDEVEKDEEFGAIESVKAASDLFAPLSGTIIEVNEALVDNPRLVSDDPMANWIIKITIADPAQADELLDQAAYDELCDKEQKH
ncbi:MAG: glycine cleavage system protein GcvH [Muribaculaceae bacterium]